MGGRVSWIGLIVGLALGLGVSLVYTWVVNPVIEFNTAPWQLSNPARDQYVAMIAEAFQQSRDLARADERLRALGDERSGVLVARIACDFFRRAADPTLTASLVDLARAYGETTCADIAMPPTGTPQGTVMIVLPTDTPTVTPTPPTATPTRRPDLGIITSTPTRTPTPPGSFYVASITAFCNPRLSGVMEVYVREANRSGIPGIPVQVTWAAGSDRFFTGLLPGKDPGYANFVMAQGQTYRVELPGRSAPSRELEAAPCTPREAVAEGQVVLTGYAVIFER